MKKKTFLLLTLIFIASATLYSHNRTQTEGKSNPLIKKYASQVIDKCKTQRYTPSCYEKEIPKLLNYISMADTFKVIIAVQEKDKSFGSCHKLSHELAAKSIEKDPSKFLEVVDSCPINMCANGCVHGAFQEHFRNGGTMSQAELQQAMPTLNTLCEKRPGWNPTPFEQTSCYHGLGHVSMLITGADIPKSIDICNKIGVKQGRNYVRPCLEGLFMQLFQPTEEEDTALVKDKQPTRLTFDSFCNQFEVKARDACHREGWILYKDEVETPQGLVEFCSYNGSDEESTKLCQNRLFVLHGVFDYFNKDKMISFCLSMPDILKDQCFANAIVSLVTTDNRYVPKALDICRFAATIGTSDGCYNKLAFESSDIFQPGSKEAKDLCSKLPANYQRTCL